MNESNVAPGDVFRHRTGLGYTQAAYGRAVGRNAVAVCRWETGQAQPTPEEWSKLQRLPPAEGEARSKRPPRKAPKGQRRRAKAARQRARRRGSRAALPSGVADPDRVYEPEEAEAELGLVLLGEPGAACGETWRSVTSSCYASSSAGGR